MKDDTDTHVRPAQKSADILGKPVFEQRRQEVAARALARREGIRKRLVQRLLNRDRDKPGLHLVD
jgi:hypothetical protein